MPFWRKETEEEKQAKLQDKIRKEEERIRQQQTIKALESGEIPPIARERIEREVAMGRNFFTSDLSTREYLLTKEAGFITIGQVMGTSFYKTGFWGCFNQFQRNTGELTVVTQSTSNARLIAVNRLKQEAKLLGASGVIGVRIQKKVHAWSSGITEFTAFGTAISIPDWPKNEEPFTSSLNGQEFWQLYKAGYLPRSLVMGVCCYYMHMDWNTRQTIFGWFAPNQEVSIFSRGYTEAVKRANSRMQTELAAVKADGAVGVSIEPHMQTIEYELNDIRYYDLLLNYVILGTAVSAHPEKEQKHESPLLCLDLRTGSFGRLGSSSKSGNYWDMAGKELIDELGGEEETSYVDY